MKVGFDVDGTFTHFDDFIIREGSKYLGRKHDISVKNKNGYGLEEVFAIRQHLISKGFSKEKAKSISYKIVQDFWYRNYPKYVSGTDFRNDASEFVRTLKRSGDEVSIFTSRGSVSKSLIMSTLIRESIKFQLINGGISYDNLFVFKSDEDKIRAINNYGLDLMFDDKPSILESIKTDTEIICMDSLYNKGYSGKIIESYSEAKRKSLVLESRL